MSYVSCCVEELFFVRWVAGVPEDLDAITAAVAAHRATVGRDIVYVSIQDTASKTPGEPFLRRMVELVPDFFGAITHLYLVLAVEGLGGSVQRRVLEAGLAAARRIDPERSAKVTLVETVEAALAHARIAPERCSAVAAELARLAIWKSCPSS